MEIIFTIPGKPYGKKRPRFGGGRAYNPKENREYERLVAFSFKSAAIKARIPVFPPPFGRKPIGIQVTAYYPIPKSTRKRDAEKMLSGELTPTVKPDLDNVLKAVLDGLNGIAYQDDKQIVELKSTKRFTRGQGAIVVKVFEVKHEEAGMHDF